MNILQEIFKDNYEQMIYELHPRQSVIENVNRMITCGDPSYGGVIYGCTSCGTLKFAPFRCHSRFCPTCGTKYSIRRMSEDDLLDMDYFLNEDDLFDDEAGVEGFYIF